MDTVSVLQLVKDSIAANHDKVMFVPLDFEGSDIWIRDYDELVTIKLVQLCLNVSEGSAHRETSREDTMWTQYYLTL